MGVAEAVVGFVLVRGLVAAQLRRRAPAPVLAALVGVMLIPPVGMVIARG